MEKLEVLYSDYKITCEYLYKLRTYFRVPFFFPIYLFIFGRAVCTAASGGVGATLQLRCVGFSVSGVSCCEASSRVHWLRKLLLMGSTVEAHRLSCLLARGIFPDQGLNWCPWHSKVLNHWTTREALKRLTVIDLPSGRMNLVLER